MRKLLLATVATLTMATSSFAQIGNLSADLVFTPLTPCRIVDTRNAGGTIPAGTARGFKAWGANFTAQGGAATNCGIPQNTNVAALALNLVAIFPATDGWMATYPFGGTLPLSSTINYLAGTVLANGAIVKVSQTSAAFDWNLHTISTTHFLADVTGYYSRPVATALECVNTTPVTAVINNGPADGLYYRFALSNACAAGYTEVAMRCTTDNAMASATAFSEPYGDYCGANANVNFYTLSASRRCCRVPGR